MSLTGAKGCILPLLVEPCSSIHVMYPQFCYFVTKLHNKACVVCESDIVAFSLLNHVIQFIQSGRQRCTLSRT